MSYLSGKIHSETIGIRSVECGICSIAKSTIEVTISSHKNATRRGNFGHSSINKHYVAQYHCACAKLPHFYLQFEI